MDEQISSVRHRTVKLLTLCSLLFAANNAMAAFVDSVGGTAIVSDATAAYYNPAALTLIHKNQLVLLGIYQNVYSHFTGTASETITGVGTFTQSGSTSSATNYYIPDSFLAIPVTQNVTLGFGEIYTFYGASEYPYNSILRYFGTTSYISVLDFIPSIGVRVNDKLALGGGLDFDVAKTTLNFVFGFPGVIADTQIVNKATAAGVGGHVGILIQPKLGTTIGLTYHSVASLNFTGHSTKESATPLSTNLFKVSIPAVPSTEFSVDQFVNRKLGFIGTVKYTQWNRVKTLNLQNVVITSATPPTPSTVAQYHLRNTWRFTLGTHYTVNPKWSLRAAVTYDQDPVNSRYQLATGTNYLLGLSAAYHFTPDVIFDLSYGHVWYKGSNINITGSNTITGSTRGHRDGVVGKLTWNL